jgi:hypothetical protein
MCKLHRPGFPSTRRSSATSGTFLPADGSFATYLATAPWRSIEPGMRTTAPYVVDRSLRTGLVAASLMCIAVRVTADSSPERSTSSEPAAKRERVAAEVPRSQYPAPGECRLWYPGRPPGEQPSPGDCRLLPAVPQGALLIRRSTSGGVDRVTAEDAVQAEAVVWIFNIAAGAVVREASPHRNALHE